MVMGNGSGRTTSPRARQVQPESDDRAREKLCAESSVSGPMNARPNVYPMPESFCSTGMVVRPPSRENVTAGEPVTLAQEGNNGGATARRCCMERIAAISSVVVILSPAREAGPGWWAVGSVRQVTAAYHPSTQIPPSRAGFALLGGHPMPSILTTARLRLVPIPLECTTSPPEAREPIAKACDADVPEAWPVEHYDQEALDYTRNVLEKDPGAEYVMRYLVTRD